MILIDTLSQSRLNQTRKKDKSRCKQLLSVTSIPTLQQISLFDFPKSVEVDDKPYPLQITSVPHGDRLKADWCCKLVHYESGLKLPGQFIYDEVKQILETTRYWDFALDSKRIPKCKDRLLVLLEEVCSDHSSSKKQEVAA